MKTSTNNPSLNNVSEIDPNIFYSLFEYSMSAILYGNPDNGDVIDANPAAALMFGYSIDELRKLNRKDLFDFNHSTMINSLKNRNEKGHVKGELIGIRKSGEHFPIEFASSIFKLLNGENRTSTTLNDISERRQSENEMKLMLDNTEESFVVIDKQLQIVSFNKQFEDVFKYFFNTDFLKGQNILNFAQKDRKPNLEAIYTKVFNGETIETRVEIPNQENEISYFNLRYKPALDNNGDIIGAFVTARDITEKVHISEKLLYEQRNTEALINATNDLIWSIDADFNLIAANQAFLTTMKIILGRDLTPGEYLLFEENVDLDFIEFWKQMYMRGFNGETFKFETVTPSIYTNVVYLETTINPILEDGRVIGVACYSRDITGIKLAHQQLEKTEQEIKKSHEQLTKLTDSIDTVVFQFEMTVDNSMTFPFVSKSVLKLVPNIDIDTIKHNGMAAFEFVHPDDIEGLMNSIFESRNNLSYWDFEHRHIMPDGKIKWIKGAARPDLKANGDVVWYGYLLDVTDRIISQENLKRANERYDIIAKASNDTIWDVDIINNRITWSEGIKQVYGYTNDEPNINCADWWYSKIHPDDIENVKKQNELWYKQKHVKLDQEYRFLCADNTYKYVFDRGFMVVEDSIPKRIIGVMQDITVRKMSEKEHEKTISLLNKTGELAKIGGWEIDFINKEHYWSPEIYKLWDLHKSFKPTLDKVLSFFLPESKSELKKAIKRGIDKGLDWDLELRAYTAIGKLIEVRVQGSVIVENNKTIKIHGTLQDITERKNIEEQLRDSDLKFKTIIDTTPECIKLISKSGELILINRAGLNMLELETSDQLKEKPLDCFVVPEYRNDSNKLFENGFKGISGSLEFELNTNKGNRIWVEADVVPMKRSLTEVDAILVVTRDVTQRKKEESLLRLLESVVTHTNDSIMITEAEPFDEPGPKIVYVNQAFTKMTGYLPEEVIGRSPRILQGPKTDLGELKRMRECMERWEPCEINIINYKKNGEEFWLNLAIKAVADETGWFTHWIAVERDITEQKSSELEREHIITELSQNNKDLKQFSYVTSHNLRAPIANLLGLTSLMDHYKIPNKSLKQIIDGIKQSALMFDETVKDLSKVLLVKDQTNLVKEEVFFNSIIENILKQLSISLQDNNVKINYEFNNATSVLFNSAYMESVFLNLFTNAIKYKSPKRKLRIDIKTAEEKGFVILKFKDNGIGIDVEKYKDKLFKLYQRFHDNPDGKGLGLYLIKSQIEAFGGSISVESEVGMGTEFIIKFIKT